jgi:polysaccharide biosynthesis protein PslG
MDGRPSRRANSPGVPICIFDPPDAPQRRRRDPHLPHSFMFRAWTSALALIAILLAIQGAASAEAANPFYGVSDVSTRTTHRDLNRLDQGHVGTVRRLLYWPAVEPRKGVFRWGQWDSIVGKLASRGIAVLPFVYGSPRYIAHHANVPPVGSKGKRKQWRRLLARLAYRYGAGGTYWTTNETWGYARQHPGKPRLPIRNWQIWNEPNLKKFFGPRPSVGRYATLVRNSHRALRSVDPHADVVLAGMSGRGDPSDRKFISRLYRARPIKRSFEAVAVNPYASKVHQVGRKIKGIRAVMRRHHDKRTPLWVTEIGWGSHRPDRFGLNKGIKGQKRMLNRSFRLIVSHRRVWHVSRLIWFDFRDPPGSHGGCSFCTSAGLLKHNGKPKPAWRAFKRFAR